MPTETANKFMGILDQTEVKYTPVSIVPGKACSSCIWYRGNYCHIVSNSPEEIVPNGYCDEHRVATPLAPQNIEPIPVVIVESPMMEDDSAEMALPTTRRGLKEMIADALKVFTNAPTQKPLEPLSRAKEQAFTAFKGKDGQYFWLARHTGKYVDREDEIIADHAHEEFVTRVQKGLVPMPELWTWHKKGTAHGQADFVWKAGGFVCALGHFTGTPEQQERAAKWYNEHPDTKLSHMFKYPKEGKRGKVYHAYNTVEITTLPDGAEAFPYTTFEEFTMPFTAAQREMIRGIGGDEMVARAEAMDTKATDDTAKNDAAGVASKTVDNFDGSIIPGADEEKALLVAQKDIDARLKLIETSTELMTQLKTSLEALVSEVATLKTSNTDAITRANDLEKKLAEYQTVAPPASKSDDTLLNAREKGILERIAEQAKSDENLSLIEKAFGGAATVSVS